VKGETPNAPDLPVVTIVGQPNVGKSELFNRLVRRRMAIVHAEPGVTRDRLIAECSLGAVPFLLIDTGGIGQSNSDSIARQVQDETDLAIGMADVILFVVDGRAGITPLDEEIGRRLRRSRRPVMVVVNKMDHVQLDASEFSQLGFDESVMVSAAHGRGIESLVEEIERHLPAGSSSAEPVVPVPEIKLAIVGRPNVGKSSLINAIMQDRRTIVSDLPGTTRDAVDIPYERSGQRFILIDTAGIRARGKHNTSVEVFSVMRSVKSIERADLCALVIDATQGVTAQDKKIAYQIGEHRKPCLIIVNKFDLVRPRSTLRPFRDSLISNVRGSLFGLDYAPITVLSAKTREDLKQLFRSLEQIEEQAKCSIGTGRLNRILQSAQESHPPAAQGGRRLKILYATQLANNQRLHLEPPVFLLFVNQGRLFTPVYRRYLEAAIRQEVEFTGLPIIFRLRDRSAQRAAK
jgi:GTPase